LWRLTRDPEIKRQAHETLVEKFNDPDDAARLALFTRENGSYESNVLGGCFFLDVVGDRASITGTCRGNGDVSIQLQGAVVTPDSIRFNPSAQPLAFVQPVYPEEARIKGRVGQDTVMLDLDENGAVSNAVILMSNPDRTFNDATLAAVTQFRFDRSQLESPADDLDLVYIIRYELPELE
jgi:TonB family protein